MRSIFLSVALVLSPAAGAASLGSISFYGDSMTYRSDWDCSGVATAPQECLSIKQQGSYPSYVTYPYPETVTPIFDVVTVNGRSGSTCHPRPAQGDPGLIPRLSYNGEDRIAVMMGINDVNLAGKSIEETVACLKAAWTIIADIFGAEPVAVTYPSIDPLTTVWLAAGTSGVTAVANRAQLNSAIYTAITEFNSTRQPGQKRVYHASMPDYSAHPDYGNTYDGVHPTPQGARSMGRFFVWSFW